jgi:hypothetical protein
MHSRDRLQTKLRRSWLLRSVSLLVHYCQTIFFK